MAEQSIPPTQEPEPRQSWERLETETGPQWAAFQVYRDLEPAERSLIAAYRKEKGESKIRVDGYWQRWYAKNRWKVRAAAYDRYVDEKVRAELEARRLQSRIDTADLGRMMRQKAHNALRMLVGVEQTVVDEDGQRVRIIAVNLKPFEIERLAKTGTELERLALGESTENIDHTVHAPITIIEPVPPPGAGPGKLPQTSNSSW